MEKHEKNLEEQFEKVEKVEIPIQYQWENMDIRMPKKRNNRNLFWILLPLFAMGIVFMFFFKFNSPATFGEGINQNPQKQSEQTPMEIPSITKTSSLQNTPEEDYSTTQNDNESTKSNSPNHVGNSLLTHTEHIPSNVKAFNVKPYESDLNPPDGFIKNNINSPLNDSTEDQTSYSKKDGSNRNSQEINNQVLTTSTDKKGLQTNDQTSIVTIIPLPSLPFRVNDSHKKISYLNLVKGISQTTSSPDKKSSHWSIELMSNYTQFKIQNTISEAEIINEGATPYFGGSLNVGYQGKIFSSNWKFKVGLIYDHIRYTFSDKNLLDTEVSSSFLQQVTTKTYHTIVNHNTVSRIGSNLLVGTPSLHIGKISLNSQFGLSPYYIHGHHGFLTDINESWADAGEITNKNFGVDGKIGLIIEPRTTKISLPIYLQLEYAQSLLAEEITFKIFSFGVGIRL